MPGGPVRLGGRVYLPVNDASVDPWQFSVYRLEHASWSRVGAVLNSGPGNAQGSVSVNGRSVWAAWQQHDPRPDGLFDARIYVQSLAPAGGTADPVWHGISLGPGDVRTVDALGGRWVVYMPQATGRNALTVRVEPLG